MRYCGGGWETMESKMLLDVSFSAFYVELKIDWFCEKKQKMFKWNSKHDETIKKVLIVEIFYSSLRKFGSSWRGGGGYLDYGCDIWGLNWKVVVWNVLEVFRKNFSQEVSDMFEVIATFVKESTNFKLDLIVAWARNLCVKQKSYFC